MPRCVCWNLLTNYKLRVAYRGTGFCGSQFQPNKKTIEGELRLALSVLHKEFIKIVFAGRTDAGVHAEGQSISYMSKTFIPPAGVRLGINSLLPDDIKVLEVEVVPLTFNARKHAISREYKYSFTQEEVPLFLYDWVSRVSFKIDEEKIATLLRIIEGTHNFRAFKNLGSKEQSDIKTILSAKIVKNDVEHFFKRGSTISIFEVSIIGHSFLYRMVRNLMGAMFEVLKKKQSVENFSEMLNNARRSYVYSAAEAKGLSLINVNYA